MTNNTQIAELRKICEILNDYGYDPDWKGGGVGVHNAAKTIQIIIKQHCESSKMLEAAEAPDDLSEWADMQFLLWDAQRRAGITDAQIEKAMIEKLEINKARTWHKRKLNR